MQFQISKKMMYKFDKLLEKNVPVSEKFHGPILFQIPKMKFRLICHIFAF